ncbi:MAG: SET domain-containing protein [Leptolyngbya sp. SIO3F4]|nr:SET domain-containing protein [Leptolyngbya sp. SIO3F4]
MPLVKSSLQKNSPLKPIYQEQFDTASNYAVVIDNERGFKSLVAQKNFLPGNCLASFYSLKETSNPSYYSVQVSENRHIQLNPTQLQYINHSCSPNVFFDTQAGEVICIKPIRIGEHITFFYPSTEWDMSNAFSCLCGSERCLGKIQGAKYLSPDSLNRYELSRHIRRLKQRR